VEREFQGVARIMSSIDAKGLEKICFCREQKERGCSIFSSTH